LTSALRRKELVMTMTVGVVGMNSSIIPCLPNRSVNSPAIFGIQLQRVIGGAMHLMLK
jgi:hypothetical protein